jgi:hypothetical protein
VRALKSAATLAGLVPMELIRGLFTRPRRQAPVPEAVQAPAAAVDTSEVPEAKRPRKLIGDMPESATDFSSMWR